MTPAESVAQISAFEARVRRALALRMGYPLGVLGRLMTYAEFLGWSRHFAEHPFDDQACVELPVAKLQAAIHNAQITDRNHLLHPSDFLPKPKEAEADIDDLVMSL